MCEINNIKDHNFSDIKPVEVKLAASLFWADGCLCVLFALLTQFKYTRVTVLNYEVCTTATSNMNWIWFFIFTALSSIMSGLNLWLNEDETSKKWPVITGWFANLFSVLFLVFAVKYQWKYREQAYNNLTTASVEETTPILPQQNGMTVFMRPSKVDILFVGLFLLSGGFFIAGWIEKTNNDWYYWIAHISMWLLQGVIYLLITIIRCSNTQQGPSVFIKSLLLAGVMLNSISDIPAYIWLNCIFNDGPKGSYYDVLVGMILISHVAFFLVMRTEFLRLRDVAIWHAVVHDRSNNIEANPSRLQSR